MLKNLARVPFLFAHMRIFLYLCAVFWKNRSNSYNKQSRNVE